MYTDPTPSQRGRPGGLVLPVERRLAGAGADPHRQAARREPLRHPAAGLARAAENQRRLLLARVTVLSFRLGVRRPAGLVQSPQRVDETEPADELLVGPGRCGGIR